MLAAHLCVAGCVRPDARDGQPTAERGSNVAAAPAPVAAAQPTEGIRPPNEWGRIPILEYHLIGEQEGRWMRTPARFREDLELLYARGYRPITIGDLIDKRIDLPAGLSPVVVTFDDASPGQFRYSEKDGQLEIDSLSAVGIWLAFHARHPDWAKKAVFCVLTAAEEGRAFFGNKNIEGQKSEWRLRKVRFLVEQGFEVCNHTLWHATLSQYDDAGVQEQIARALMAIDSAVPGYRVRTFALPLGKWPKNRALTTAGAWTDPKSGRTIQYRHDAVLLVAGVTSHSPFDSAFNALSLGRQQVFEDELRVLLDRLDRTGLRYVSDGDPGKVSRPSR
jgi:peptidoglycan/xylan/chitin deacetylase (PgdA/CDA1 family)